MELCVVIPCHNEPELLVAINSLASCIPPKRPVKLVIVVNAEANCDEAVAIQNKCSTDDVSEWMPSKPAWLQIHVLELVGVPLKIAGVGNARKYGMDFACEMASDKKNAVIVCLDADCTCSYNYLVSIETAFESNLKNEVASVYFEHDVNDNEAIVNYELFLRYHYQGLRSAGYPYAFQTIGSSMAVRADTYEAFGGMNQRKAGEDFYFLHKVIPYRAMVEINDCAVYPSSRTSDRVPFGTGHAVAKGIEAQCPTYYTYHPHIYFDISRLIEAFNCSNRRTGVDLNQVSTEIQVFLQQEKFEKSVANFINQHKTDDLLRQAFFRWMNGFRMLKLVHHLRDVQYTNLPIHEAVRLFWKTKKHQDLELKNIEWLFRFRQLEKG